MADPGPFGGIPSAGFEFLRGLAANNTKTFFDAHRDTYRASVAEPAKALVADLGAALRSEIDGTIEFDPKVGRSLFRINRDTRFSKDKTPYRPWIDCVFWRGSSPRKSPGFLLRLTPDHLWLGSGIMHPEPEQLAAYREAVASDEEGDALAALLAALGAMPGVGISEPARVRVPKGFDPDHPRERLLRMDGVHALMQCPTPSEVHGAEFIDWCVERYRPFAPLFAWLVGAME